MQHLGIVREDDYVERLRGAASTFVETELRNLLNLVTVTETCFFRDGAQFRLLRDYIIPTLIAERAARSDGACRIRIWSAGCSSGEEAYSIAITLDEVGAFQALPEGTIEIIGTDLNSKALEKARRGVYTARAVRNVEGRLLDRYFARDGKLFALSDTIKKQVKFEFGNLTQTPMPSTGPQDVVFCKNVAIYFRPDVARKLIEGLRDTLAADGYLLLGHAESLWQMSEGFALVEYDRAFCYRKTCPSAVVPTFRSAVAPARAPAKAGAKAGKAGLKAGTTYVATYVTEDPTGQYESCLAAFRAGEWDDAESALRALVAASPTFVPGLLLLGGLYVHRGRFEDAMAQAQTVLNVSDLEARAHLLLGMIAARRQRHHEALQSLRRALYLDDSLALGHFWLGNLYRERGDIGRACQEYENVVRDWERRTFQLTEEFASDLTADQLVEYCRQYVVSVFSRTAADTSNV